MSDLMDILMPLERRNEGSRLVAYKDTKGNWTIGVGHNLAARGLPWVAGDPSETDWGGYTINEAQEHNLLLADLAESIRDSSGLECWNSLSDRRKAAIVDMCFSMGINKLKTFGVFLAYMDAGRYEAASEDRTHTSGEWQVGVRGDVIRKMILA